MSRAIDPEVFERCLQDLMRRRNVTSYIVTAFDAADIVDLLDEAVTATEQRNEAL